MGSGTESNARGLRLGHQPLTRSGTLIPLGAYSLSHARGVRSSDSTLLVFAVQGVQLEACEANVVQIPLISLHRRSASL